jgi:hypothetical protein
MRLGRIGRGEIMDQVLGCNKKGGLRPTRTAFYYYSSRLVAGPVVRDDRELGVWALSAPTGELGVIAHD